ncbi:MAG: aminoacetone oxidase family FAD-binding enzyme, partial [bacterium]|nr:aminoacetone oxidase family FAD-binding enzyme [bacterium]
MEKMYDVVVIGGGPAGMMAAGRVAEKGRSVLLLEKNPGLGKKLLITGGGRCNLTNNKTEVRTMLSKYKGNDQFLFSAFAQFSVKDALEFFNSRGLATKEENEGRIFPVTDSAKSVFDVLVKYMKEGKVEVKTGVEVKGISQTREGIVIETSGGAFSAAACVLATGGISRPETGSTGEGFKWLKVLGHTVIDNDFALVPIALENAIGTSALSHVEGRGNPSTLLRTGKLGGVSLKNIKLTTFQNSEKQSTGKGDVMFTHFGITGPLALNMSKEIGELLKYGKVTAEIDLFPAKDAGAVKKELQTLLAAEPNKKIKNVLSKLIPGALALALLGISHIDGETKNNMVSAADRKKLAQVMKAIPLRVSHLLGADKAVVSSGGVALEAVNFKTMQSR